MPLISQSQNLETPNPHLPLSTTANPDHIPRPPALPASPTMLHPAMCLRLHVLTAMAGKACLEIPSPPSFRPVPAKITKSALLSPTPSRFLSARMSSMGKRPLILSSMVMMTLRTRRAQAGSAQATREHWSIWESDERASDEERSVFLFSVIRFMQLIPHIPPPTQ